MTHHPAPSIIVIGAGPAGCSAAIHLARAGWSVTLIEARPFPRIKVCGEFISPAASGVLESLLRPDELFSLGARRISTLVLEAVVRGEERRAEWEMPSPAWVLSRRTLDTALVDRCREEGVAVIQPVTVRAVRCGDSGVEVAMDGRVLHAQAVVHADGTGRHDVPASGRAAPTRMRPGVVGFKAHLRLPPGRAVQGLRMRAGAGAYTGFVGVEGGLTTVALVARKERIAAVRGDGDALLSALWPAYSADWRESEWLSCGVACGGYRAGGHVRSFRVGNAAAAVEPVGGEGIGLALWSGWMLAGALGSPAGADFVGAQRAYARAYRRRLRLRRPACRLAAEVLMRPSVVGAVWPFMEKRGIRAALLAPWYALTGKA